MRRFIGAVIGGMLVAVMAYALTITPHRGERHDFYEGIRVTTIEAIDGTSTGNAALVLPTDAVGALEFQGHTLKVIFCGELAENGTIYMGPVPNTTGEPAIDATACDAQVNATEATADAVIMTGAQVRPMGMECVTNATLGAGETIVVTLRASEASIQTTTAVDFACTMSVGETTCVRLQNGSGLLTTVAPVAIRAVMASNNADADDLKCAVWFNVN